VRPIEITDDQVIVFAANMRDMRSLADQINAQNKTRAQRCG
jgi:ribosomal silencing factor RsfS